MKLIVFLIFFATSAPAQSVGERFRPVRRFPNMRLREIPGASATAYVRAFLEQLPPVKRKVLSPTSELVRGHIYAEVDVLPSTLFNDIKSEIEALQEGQLDLGEKHFDFSRAKIKVTRRMATRADLREDFFPPPLGPAVLGAGKLNRETDEIVVDLVFMTHASENRAATIMALQALEDGYWVAPNGQRFNFNWANQLLHEADGPILDRSHDVAAVMLDRSLEEERRANCRLIMKQ